MVFIRVFIFGSVRFLLKKIINPNFFKKKTETEPKPIQTDRFRFGFLEQKPVQTGFARFFPVWLGFSGLARFFQFGSVFAVPGLKNRNRTGRFFQNFNRFNRFFFTVRFFRLFFFQFSRFNQFFNFFKHPKFSSSRGPRLGFQLHDMGFPAAQS